MLLTGVSESSDASAVTIVTPALGPSFGTAPAGTLDLDGVPGAETTVTQGTGCPAGGAVELWRMEGVEHIPALTPGWPAAVWAFLAANPKP